MATNFFDRIRSLPGNTLSQSTPDRRYMPPQGLPLRPPQTGQQPPAQWWQQHTQGNTLGMPGPMRAWMEQLQAWHAGGRQGTMPQPTFMQNTQPNTPRWRT